VLHGSVLCYTLISFALLDGTSMSEDGIRTPSYTQRSPVGGEKEDETGSSMWGDMDQQTVNILSEFSHNQTARSLFFPSSAIWERRKKDKKSEKRKKKSIRLYVMIHDP
jgi:hypothetical protein